jgi:hypothetical protein
MKTLLLLTVLAATTGNLTEGPKQGAAPHKQEIPAQVPTNPSPVTVVIDNAQRSEPTNTPAPKSPSGDTAPEWALVVVGIITFIIIGLQTRATANAAKTMRDSLPLQKSAAKAALLNAQAIINSERPWVMVQVKEVPIEDVEHYHGNLFGKNGFQLTIFNYGKTPAHLLDFKELRFDVLEHPDEDMPIPPQYGASSPTKRFLAPTDSLPIGHPFHPHNVRLRIMAERLQKGETTQGDLVVYGLIEYSDGVSTSTFRTAFCYRHDHAPASITGSLVPCGPREYNDYT